jgi:hypothetical protein
MVDSGQGVFDKWAAIKATPLRFPVVWLALSQPFGLTNRSAQRRQREQPLFYAITAIMIII